MKCLSFVLRSCTRLSLHLVENRSFGFETGAFVMPPRKSERSQARQDRSITPEDPVHSHRLDSASRPSLVPVQLDKFWGDDREDLDSWLFHVTSVAQLERWPPQLQLRHAAVALAGRARAEYHSFVAVTPETDLS